MFDCLILWESLFDLCRMQLLNLKWQSFLLKYKMFHFPFLSSMIMIMNFMKGGREEEEEM